MTELDTKFIQIGCNYSGVSGDLLISSLAGIIGLSKVQTFLVEILQTLSKKSKIKVQLVEKINHGVKGLYLQTNIKEESHFKYLNQNHPQCAENDDASHNKDSHSHDHQHGNHQQQSHQQHSHQQHNQQHGYKIKEMKQDLLNITNLSFKEELTKKGAQKALEIIIEAESKVHGIEKEKVHLHEIGSIDTIIDICVVFYILEKLNVFAKQNSVNLFCTEVAVGGGMVKTAHGLLPVPAPATQNILNSYKIPIKFGPEDLELATPTGVAILAALKDIGVLSFDDFTHPFIILKKGVGVGTLELKNQPNMLQVSLCETAKNNSNDKVRMVDKFENSKNSQPLPQSKQNDLSMERFGKDVYLLKTNVDDVRGELIGDLIPNLMKRGALDVFLISTITKKNRPGYLISIICNKGEIPSLTDYLIKATGTLGVRVIKQQRVCLERSIMSKNLKIQGKNFKVRVKKSTDFNGNVVQRKIEFEDLQKIAEKCDLTPKEVEDLILNL